MATAALQATARPRTDRGRADARCPRTRAALRRPDLGPSTAPH